MVLPIENDLDRFRRIVRGRVRKDLRRFMGSDELVGRQGKKVVSIPIPEIHIPRFRYGPNEQGGVGQGEGDPGDPVDGAGEAGDAPGEHMLEAEVTIEELAEILGEELELPRIEPRGRREVASPRSKYTGISLAGPESLRHARRTFRQALKRQIAAGTYDPANPVVIPVKEDRRYRSFQVETEPSSAAIILYIMDVSGSMGQKQKDLVRLETFWIDAWLTHNYRNIDTRFIIHDAAAREVDRDTFFRTKESGGTLISSAYREAVRILEADYPPADWNIYVFQFSDGDNWSTADTQACLEILGQKILPVANLFGYGQVDSEYGSGQFHKDLEASFGSDERVVLTRIPERDAIMDSIRAFLGKGR
ncbi:MAG: DUF444 family protein [Deltaproteobacteria bacterium]|nr:DUF444 family protein [Deltaproteobacteria bacterium]